MTADSRNGDTPRADRALITDALNEARRNRDLLARATRSNENALTALEAVLQQGAAPALEPTDTQAERRRNHRTGTPSRTESDPELAAFIRARIDTLTFKEITAAIAAHFPPERRVSLSSVHRWWQRNSPAPDSLNRE